MTGHLPALRLAATGFVALALAVTACGSSAGSTPASTVAASAPTPAPIVLDVDGFAGSLGDLDGATVTVNGFFLIADGGARLCAMVLESYPPRCGGASIRVLGQVPQAVLDALESTSDPSLAQASWGTVSITGTVDASGTDGLPTITIDSISVAPPAPGG